jgi:hypothetical protein
VTVFKSGDVAEVASLSARQVRRLLKTLELHRAMLQAGHEDASRYALHRRRPAYLLDFQLLFRYAFLPVERPEWANELEYLLGCQSTKFLIGPGTQFEMNQFMHTAGVMLGDDGSLEDPGPSAEPDYEIYGLDGETVRVGIFRLNELFALPNVLRYGEVVADPVFDEETLNHVKGTLGLHRPNPGKSRANHWDALNWVAVSHMRQRTEAATGLYPYLLTATRPLLDASAALADFDAPVARKPTDAIYTEILFSTYPDPVGAANHTIQMAVKAATLEEGLRQSPAFLSPDEFRQEPEWEQAVQDRRITDELREQLKELARFVTDPVVTETQRIYDNARIASASAEQQRGTVLGILDESPRKLFDLIIEVDAVLNAGLEQSGLSELWTTMLEMDTEEHESRTTYELFDRDSDPASTQYLAAERYLAVRRRSASRTPDAASGDDREQFVLRWPTAMDAETVVASFSRAFAKHDIETVDLVVGTTSSVEHFGATLPITLADVMEAVSEEEPDDGSAPAGQQLQWVRMGARIFDLYADVGPADLTRQPVVGVFVDSLNPEHLQDLYTRTSARYLLPAWFRQAMVEIQN